MHARTRFTALLVGAATAAAVVALPATAASAAGSEGWLRLAHLSPDTKKVDVTLTSLAGSSPLYKLKSVGYGDVSKYLHLKSGTYAVAMVPAGSDSAATPVVSGQVNVQADMAETIAAIGPNKSIDTKVYVDQLDMPSDGKARVRVVQASVKQKSVDVKAGSTSLGSNVDFGDATDYQDVSAGDSTLQLKGGSRTDDADVSLPAGSVHTVFVLDKAAGSLTANAVLDSSAGAETPFGSVDTGGGGLARADAAASTQTAAAVGGGIALALLFGGAGVVLRRRTAFAAAQQRSSSH